MLRGCQHLHLAVASAAIIRLKCKALVDERTFIIRFLCHTFVTVRQFLALTPRVRILGCICAASPRKRLRLLPLSSRHLANKVSLARRAMRANTTSCYSPRRLSITREVLAQLFLEAFRATARCSLDPGTPTLLRRIPRQHNLHLVILAT